MSRPRLIITMGDINGIGPEILAKALSHPELWTHCQPLVIGSAKVLEEARRFAPGCPPPKPVDTIEPGEWHPDQVRVLETLHEVPDLRVGQLDPAAGACAVEWVKAAVERVQSGEVAGIVTCPINKEGIHKAGYAYSGHTDLIAELTGRRDYRMCLFSETLRVVHVSAHLSLRDAIAALTPGRISQSIRIGHEALVQLGLPRRRIAVAGLNPHAGEAGAFGHEEIEIIAPAIRACQQEGIYCSGPHPPDTVFARMNAGEFELVVAMYHDQGHIAVKLLSMDSGVNVTLGIPIVRTSPDHGTAYDIAGKGLAREDSMCAAIRLAAQLAQGRQEKAE